MTISIKILIRSVAVVLMLVLSPFLFSFHDNADRSGSVKFPYKQAGLTDRQAAAHLLSRFTFGAKPGQVDEVLAVGLETWFQQQLNSQLPDIELNQRLSAYDAMKMSNTEIVNTFSKPGTLLRMAINDGVVNKDSVNKAEKGGYRDALQQYMQQKGLKPQGELFRQLANQKVLRAAYSENQLREVLTDFWFNHFNVSITKNDCAEFIPVYERDAIRPNVLSKFGDLLLATAKSPAMLLYLDNASSSGVDSSLKLPFKGKSAKKQQSPLSEASPEMTSMQVQAKLKIPKKASGLNENYAREVMELHTLGVEGGYTQNDVTEAARVMSGWTVYPMKDYGTANGLRKIIDKIGEDKMELRGFVREGDFLFAANRHDNGVKVVLGKTFSPAGYQEGVQLLNILAHHSSTAKFISKKLAVRFVNDNPSPELVNKMAKTFVDKDGDIKAVLTAMVSSVDFWNKDAVREKTKSPFELAISAVRGLNAEVNMPSQLFTWVEKMGQKLYYYQAPTGFPDKAQNWINTGALLNRMNFGLALAAQRIPGVTFNLSKLNQGHEPESAEAALLTFASIIMPERNIQSSVKHLTPLLLDPGLQQKVEDKASKQPVPGNNIDLDQDMAMTRKGEGQRQRKRFASVQTAGATGMLSQVVGVLIGSPEFQRR